MPHDRFLMTESKKPLTILLASPRGFCAGVDRAIQIVERAIERYGRPVYVRHEIVHNRFVVENLEAKGANARLSHSAGEILTSAFPAEAIDGHSIQLYFTTLLAHECQATINVSSAQDAVTLSVSPPPAPADTQ